MYNLLNPRWLFILNTFPIVILFLIFYGEYEIIKSLLNEESKSLWKTFGSILATLGILNFVYALFLSLSKKKVSSFYGLISLIAYTIYSYMFLLFSDDIIPFSIPRWMIPGDMYIYVFTFLMPTLAYSLFIIVVRFTPNIKDHKAWKNFLFAVLIPIAWFILSQLILPFIEHNIDSSLSIHSLIIFIITGTLLFLFFLSRSIYILISKKAKNWKKYSLLWEIPISLIFPLIGLSVNNGNSPFSLGTSGIIGDFDNIWFYVLTVLNAIFICLPSFKIKSYRLILLIGRSITFAFTFYFFIVFLPFLPISVIAIVAIGLGFLLISPLMLFILHINKLSDDLKYLQYHYKQRFLYITSTLCFLAIPSVITFNYYQDRITLTNVLDYVYTPDYSKSYNIDTSSLKSTIDVLKSNKVRADFSIYKQTPYLSSYYKWLVLDNLTISDTKINRIESIFFGNKLEKLSTPSFSTAQNSVEISDISSNSTFHEAEGVWISWVNLEITNNDDRGFVEYSTTFELLKGAWISDYYLYLGDEKKMGFLAEKKSALWVFSNIRNENRDPGILFYNDENKISFKVFPFAENEVRKTGIEIIHKEPLQFEIDNHKVQLGVSDKYDETIFENEHVAYVPTKAKKDLEVVNRTPYFHFILDITNKQEIDDLINSVRNFLIDKPLLNKNAQISFVSSSVTSTAMKNDWKTALANHKSKGGFYLDRAIKLVLVNSYTSKSNSYPIMVVVTNSLDKAIIQKNYADLKFTYPENNLFYHLQENQNLNAHSLISKSDTPLHYNYNCDYKIEANKTVLKYRFSDNSIAYLQHDTVAEIIAKSDLIELSENDITEKSWVSALNMHAKSISHILHPEKEKEEWLKQVKSSFKTKIMIPGTSYLVLENDAQEASLLRKQKQVLNSNKSLDLDENSKKMSEPGWLVIFLLLLYILFNKRKEIRTQLN